ERPRPSRPAGDGRPLRRVHFEDRAGGVTPARRRLRPLESLDRTPRRRPRQRQHRSGPDHLGAGPAGLSRHAVRSRRRHGRARPRGPPADSRPGRGGLRRHERHDVLGADLGRAVRPGTGPRHPHHDDVDVSRRRRALRRLRRHDLLQVGLAVPARRPGELWT
ncbi:hypothetical protein GMDG_09011, partial [Pseudogymnoascus destructans 20631-21]